MLIFLKLSKDYKTYSLVASCSPIIPGFLNYKYIWILSRQKTLDQNTVSRLLGLIKSKGMSTYGFKLTEPFFWFCFFSTKQTNKPQFEAKQK
jgi:lipocalin